MNFVQTLVNKVGPIGLAINGSHFVFKLNRTPYVIKRISEEGVEYRYGPGQSTSILLPGEWKGLFIKDVFIRRTVLKGPFICIQTGQ